MCDLSQPNRPADTPVIDPTIMGIINLQAKQITRLQLQQRGQERINHHQAKQITRLEEQQRGQRNALLFIYLAVIFLWGINFGLLYYVATN